MNFNQIFSVDPIMYNKSYFVLEKRPIKDKILLAKLQTFSELPNLPGLPRGLKTQQISKISLSHTCYKSLVTAKVTLDAA